MIVSPAARMARIQLVPSGDRVAILITWGAKLVIEHPAGGSDSRIALGIGDRVRAELVRVEGEGLRGGVALGRASADSPPVSESGVRVAAVLDRLDFDAWRAVLERVAPASDPGAEGAGAADAAFLQRTRDRLDHADLQRLCGCQLGQQAGEAARQQRLARARRADH